MVPSIFVVILKNDYLLFYFLEPRLVVLESVPPPVFVWLFTQD